jgi:hypothetical protein
MAFVNAKTDKTAPAPVTLDEYRVMDEPVEVTMKFRDGTVVTMKPDQRQFKTGGLGWYGQDTFGVKLTNGARVTVRAQTTLTINGTKPAK